MSVKAIFNSFMETSEQNLVQDLISECIQIHGINCWYIPRTLVNEDYLFGEDPISAFEDSFEIEMYLETFDQYGGDGDLMTKFGLHIMDEATLTVSATRFLEEVGFAMPLEGDLIYIPMSNVLLEIRFVEDEEQFYALGKNYQFKIKAQLFEYSREDFATGIEKVDVIQDALDDSVGKQGEDIYGKADELEVEGDNAIDPTEEHIFGAP